MHVRNADRHDGVDERVNGNDRFVYVSRYHPNRLVVNAPLTTCLTRVPVVTTNRRGNHRSALRVHRV